jgi:mannobiose 2-epimerase
LLHRAASRAHKALLLPQRLARTGRWPELAEGRELEAGLAGATPRLERILCEAILPFWRERSVDRRLGGYHLNHDRRGRDIGPAPKHVVAQARMLWFFSRVHESPWRADSDAEAARHGFVYLRDRLWDAREGGFFWQVEPDGEPLAPDKHALSQCCAIYALSRFAAAFGDREALDLAVRTFELYDERAHDDRHGGYREMLRRDWSDAHGLTGYWAADPNLKLLDTHLHLLEAFAALHAVRPDKGLERRIRELVDILTTADLAHPQGVTCFRPDWTPLRKTRVEYGFDVKRIWTTEAAARTIGIGRETMAELHCGLFDKAVHLGWDLCEGGFFNAGRPDRRADELTKTWWTQAEALVASAWMWRASGEPRYAALFLGMLDWIFERQVDWDCGEWHEVIDHRGRVSGRKAWEWKAALHDTRAVVECLGLLGRAVG